MWIAGDGSEALRILEEEHVDIILTDIVMPVMDGLELIAAVRAKDRSTFRSTSFRAVLPISHRKG
ncbi:MAG: response regulator [Desulfobacterales bacterium]|nr:response regulator [Desulfobacterales bacterium]